DSSAAGRASQPRLRCGRRSLVRSQFPLPSHANKPQNTRSPANSINADCLLVHSLVPPRPEGRPMHSARTGSLENPEVLENVPGHIIPILEREFDDFDTESTRYLTGELDGETFTKFRLKQGVYGQRQPDVQMVRVKLPLGGISPEQFEAFADGIEKYVPLRKGHITTRQNIQMHHVPLPDAAALIRELGDAGLSSREGCGNTMRNVTGDPRAGT